MGLPPLFRLGNPFPPCITLDDMGKVGRLVSEVTFLTRGERSSLNLLLETICLFIPALVNATASRGTPILFSFLFLMNIPRIRSSKFDLVQSVHQ